MSSPFDRALLLFQQSRFDLAEKELHAVLAADPHDAFAHSLLGLCLAHREQFKEATDEAVQAIHLAPDFPHAHYALASIYHDRHRNDEALPRLTKHSASMHPTLTTLPSFPKSRWTNGIGTMLSLPPSEGSRLIPNTFPARIYAPSRSSNWDAAAKLARQPVVDVDALGTERVRHRRTLVAESRPTERDRSEFLRQSEIRDVR